MDLDPMILVVNGLIGAIGIGGALYGLAVRLDNETRLHALCLEAHRLQEEKIRRIRALRGEPVEVDIIEEEDGAAEGVEVAEAVEAPGDDAGMRKAA